MCVFVCVSVLCVNVCDWIRERELKTVLKSVWEREGGRGTFVSLSTPSTFHREAIVKKLHLK